MYLINNNRCLFWQAWQGCNGLLRVVVQWPFQCILHFKNDIELYVTVVRVITFTPISNVRFIARKYATATSTKNFVAMFCTNVFPNRTKSEENGGKNLFSPSRTLYSFHCKIFTKLTKLNGITWRYYIPVWGKSLQLHKIFLCLKVFTAACFGLYIVN